MNPAAVFCAAVALGVALVWLLAAVLFWRGRVYPWLCDHFSRTEVLDLSSMEAWEKARAVHRHPSFRLDDADGIGGGDRG